MSEELVKNVSPESAIRPRLWPAILILTLGIGRQIWIWNVWQPDRTVQTIHSYLTGLPTVLLLGVWWLFFSRISWKFRALGVGLVLAMIAVLACLLRIDDVTGEVFPIFAWSWTPRREAIAKAYIVEQRERQRSQKQLASENPLASNKPDPRRVESALPAIAATDSKLKASDETDFPGFRGSQRDGFALDGQIRTNWEEQPPVALWRHPIGLGWSSFSVAEGLAYTQEQRFDAQDQDVEAIVCYDVLTGQQVWEHQDPARFTHSIGGDGPRATPTWNEGRVYTFGATGILNCLDARTGEKIWSHDVLVENSIPNAEYGMTGSPLVFEDLVIVNPGGADNKALMAFDGLTGELVWSQGSDRAAYASPQVSVVDGVPQILIFDAVGVAGHALKSGQQMWKYPWTNGSGINASQPIVTESNHVLASTSYGVGSVMLRVSHSGTDWKAEPLWKSNQLRLKFNCGVVRDHFLYGLDEGILACFDLHDGKLKWKGGRYSFGQLLLVGDKLLVLAQSGDVILVDATPDRFHELSRFHAIDGKTWNNPAVWKGLLLVRNSTEAACYDLRIRGEK